MNIEKLNRFLTGVDTQDSDVNDGILDKIGGAFKGAVQGWKNAGKNNSSSKTNSLAEHDKKFHPNGYNEGDSCKFRESMKQGDKSDKIDGGDSGSHKLVGGDRSGKSAAANYLSMVDRGAKPRKMYPFVKKDGRDRDEVLSDISMKYGPSSRAILIDKNAQEKNERDRQNKIREALSFHGIDESTLTDMERKDLGLSKPIKIQQKQSGSNPADTYKNNPSQYDDMEKERKRREHEVLKKHGLPDLPDGLSLHTPHKKTNTPISNDGTAIWHTEWANSSHELNGQVKKKDIFNLHASRAIMGLLDKMKKANNYSPHVMAEARINALKAAEKYVKENPKASSLEPMGVFQNELDAAWERHIKK